MEVLVPRPSKIRFSTNRKVTARATESAVKVFGSVSGIQAKMTEEPSISIYGVIGEDVFSEGVTLDRIDAALRSIGNRDVTVNINSPGGDVFEGIGIYNRLRDHPYKVNVKVMGLAASAASVIAMAGDNIQIGAASFLMIHNAWVLAAGNQHDFREVADFLEPFDNALAGVYVERTGIELESIRSQMNKETWISGNDAVEQGFADALLSADEITEDKVAAIAAPDVNAARIIEAAMTNPDHERMPRQEVRKLIYDLKGKSDAAPENAMLDAGDPELTGVLAGFLKTLRA